MQRRLFSSINLLALALLPALPPVTMAQRDPNAFASLGTLNISSGTLTINTDTRTMSGAASFTGVFAGQANGPAVTVFNFNSINITGTATVTITGTHPLVLLSLGNTTITPPLLLNGGLRNSGAGGYWGAEQPSSPGYGPGGGFGTNPGYGGGHGGRGGTASSPQGTMGGEAYGNLLTTLQGGSGGGSNNNLGSLGGGGGGAIEIGALGAVTVSSIQALGGNSPTGGGGGAGGGILLNGNSISYSLLGTGGGAGSGTGGGGGRIALLGFGNYSIGSMPPLVTASGGNGGGVTPGFAGVITVDANSTTVPTGKSVVLNGQLITSVAGQTGQTDLFVEAYIRKDLQINTGGTATLGMDNALRRLDSSGNNITDLNVNGTFNTSAYNQTVSKLLGTGTINLNPGGSLTVGENNANSIFEGTITGIGGLNKIGNGTLSLATSGSNFTGPTTIQAGGPIQFIPAGGSLTYSSSISGPGGITQIGTGTLFLTGNNTYSGGTLIFGGTLQIGSLTASSPFSYVSIANTAGATFHASNLNVTTAGLDGGGTSGGSAITDGNLTLAPAFSITFSGSVSGTGNLIKAASGTQVLAGSNSWTGTTTVQQGTLQFNSPLTSVGGIVRVEGSGTLQANASITRPILGNGPGSTINIGASGITLGDASSFVGFNHQGMLNVGANSVTLASANQPRLGSLTTLGSGGTPGTINAAKGVYLDFATAMTGYGTINTPNNLVQRSIINGTVEGSSGAQPITFTGWVKGVGTFNNVVFAGTFDPGLSPTLITAGSLGFSSTNNLIMELGGLTRGSQFDGIEATGNVNLDGALSVVRINGFNPNVADAFVLINRTGGTGTFTGLNEGDSFPGADGGLYVISYQGMNYMTNLMAPGANGFSVVIAAVPEPATIALMALGLGGAAGGWWYRRSQRAKMLNTLVECDVVS